MESLPPFCVEVKSQIAVCLSQGELKIRHRCVVIFWNVPDEMVCCFGISYCREGKDRVFATRVIVSVMMSTLLSIVATTRNGCMVSCLLPLYVLHLLLQLLCIK